MALTWKQASAVDVGLTKPSGHDDAATPTTAKSKRMPTIVS